MRFKCNVDKLMELPCGSLVEITGYYDKGEICVEDVVVLHKPIREEYACVEDIPGNPVEYTARYYLYIRRPEIAKIVKTYFYIVDYARRFLVKQGFIELPTVITGYSSDPGLRGASKIGIKLYGRDIELQSSLIMYKQLYASIFDKVFYVAKNIRLEPEENAYTGRHLSEFTQVDVEYSIDKPGVLLELAERLLYRTTRYLIEKHREIFSDRNIEKLEREVVKPPYPRLTYDEAIGELKKMGYVVKYGLELDFKAESAIADRYQSPVWITDFPSESRGFYYVENPDRPGFNVDYNLILPSGHGEVLDGGCREYRYEKVVERIAKRHGEDPGKYSWFLEVLSAGLIRPTCGWGLGVERLVKYIHDLKHIAYATPHPRLPGVMGP